MRKKTAESQWDLISGFIWYESGAEHAVKMRRTRAGVQSRTGHGPVSATPEVWGGAEEGSTWRALLACPPRNPLAGLVFCMLSVTRQPVLALLAVALPLAPLRAQERVDLLVAATTDVHGRLRGWDADVFRRRPESGQPPNHR